jgi:hypothetical protein
VLFHERYVGKGGAIHTAIPYATAEIVLIQDADLDYDPRDYAILLEPILEGGAAAIFGTASTAGPTGSYLWHAIGNRLLTTLCNVEILKQI